MAGACVRDVRVVVILRAGSGMDSVVEAWLLRETDGLLYLVSFVILSGKVMLRLT